MRTINFLVDANAAVAQTTVGVEVGEITNYSVQVNPSSDSGVDGTLVLQSSNDNVVYVDVPSSSQAVVAGASHIWNVTGAGYKYVRVTWTPTAATSGLAWARAAGVAAKTGKAWAIKNDQTGLTWVRYGDVTGATYTALGSTPYTVTVTSNNHSLDTGAVIAVSGGSNAAVNGAKTITRTGANTFTFTTVASPGATGTLNFTTGGMGKAWSSAGAGPYTVTVTSVGHKIEAGGGAVVIANSTVAGLNGTQTVTVTTADAFTFDVAVDPSGPGTLDWSISGTGKAYATVGSTPWTVTVASATNNLVTGDQIAVSGGSDGDVDGTQTITASTNSFTFSVASDPSWTGTLNYAGMFAEVTQATHGLVAGQSITCSGTSDAVIDAVHLVSTLGLVAGKFRFKTVTPITSTGTSNLAYYKTATPTVEVTSNSHGIASATVVAVASSGEALLNGNKAVTSTGINTFTLPAAAGALSGASGTLAYQGISFDIQVTESAHGLTTGDGFTVAGSSAAVLDGAHVVTTYAAGTFNFTNVSADPGASGTLGYLGIGTISALFIGKDNPNRA